VELGRGRSERPLVQSVLLRGVIDFLSYDKILRCFFLDVTAGMLGSNTSWVSMGRSSNGGDLLKQQHNVTHHNDNLSYDRQYKNAIFILKPLEKTL